MTSHGDGPVSTTPLASIIDRSMCPVRHSRRLSLDLLVASHTYVSNPSTTHGHHDHHSWVVDQVHSIAEPSVCHIPTVLTTHCSRLYRRHHNHYYHVHPFHRRQKCRRHRYYHHYYYHSLPFDPQSQGLWSWILQYPRDLDRICPNSDPRRCHPFGLRPDLCDWWSWILYIPRTQPAADPLC